jgi:hypothetical protein
MSKVVEVAQLPTCDFCPGKASYDAKTLFGPWANMCQIHFDHHTTGQLGTGFGQKLVATI